MTARYIACLSLSHLRAHRALSLSLDGRPVVLCGANGAGKTTILEAVSLFSPGRGLRGAAPDELARQPEGIGWKLKAELGLPAGASEIEIEARPGTSRQVRIDGKAATASALAGLLRIVWASPAMDRLWIEGAEGRRRFLDRLTLGFAPSHAAQSARYERALRERNRLLRDQVRDPAWYGALEAQMAEAGAAISGARADALARIRAARDEAPPPGFPEVELWLGGPEEALTQSDAATLVVAFAEGRRRDLAAGRTLCGPHRVDLEAALAGTGLPAAQASTGEQKALLLSVIVAQARALAALDGAPPLMLLDEVAAHLDADRRAALFDALCDLGAQAWMTGTEAALFAPLGPRAQAFAISSGAGGSHVAQTELDAPHSA